MLFHLIIVLHILLPKELVECCAFHNEIHLDLDAAVLAQKPICWIRQFLENTQFYLKFPFLPEFQQILHNKCFPFCEKFCL